MAKAKPASTGSSIGDYIRRQRQAAQLSLRKLAAQSGISAAVLQEVENGLRDPSGTIVQSVARVLRMSAETLQLQAGVIDPKELDDNDVVREIRRDPQLTEPQRNAMVEVYKAFCLANRDSR
jgi:transcriptional regulator with XRE-family HTH domain